MWLYCSYLKASRIILASSFLPYASTRTNAWGASPLRSSETLLHLGLSVNYEVWKSSVDVVATTTSDLFAINAPAMLTKVDFEAFFFGAVEIVAFWRLLFDWFRIYWVQIGQNSVSFGLDHLHVLFEGHLDRIDLRKVARPVMAEMTIMPRRWIRVTSIPFPWKFGKVSWAELSVPKWQPSCGIHLQKAKRLYADCHGRQ